MPTLSVFLIVKNEAACLAECLGSVRAIADEIVVADTGSMDNTLEIARAFQAKTSHIPWRDDFAAARNEAMAAATGGWLLHMDADELLDSGGAARLRALVDADGGGADAIELTVANYGGSPHAWRWVPSPPGDPMARGHAGYIKAELLRLFRNGRGYEYREPIHENITESVVERGGVIGRADITIHHYGYGAEGRRAREKAERYLAIARAKAQRMPGYAKAWHDLAEQTLVCGDAAGAEEACRQALRLDSAYVPALMSLANLLLNRGELEAARECLESVMARPAHPSHADTALGAIAYKQGRLDEARVRLEAALEQAPQTVLARDYLARVYEVLGDTARALASLRAAVTQCPGLDVYRRRLEAVEARLEGEARFARGEFTGALEAFKQALALDPDSPVTYNNIGVVLARLGDRASARRNIERALRLCPGYGAARENLRDPESCS